MIVHIDLDQQPLLVKPSDLFQNIYLKEIVFEFTPDNLPFKMVQLSTYIQFINSKPDIQTTLKLRDLKKYSGKMVNSVAVGGTFDHLHLGHQIFLMYTVLSSSDKVYIGVTSHSLLIKKNLRQMIQPWSVRMQHVQKFVHAIKPQIEIQLFELNDLYGPTILPEKHIEGLLVSKETYPGGLKINDMRKTMNMKQLQLFVCPTITTDSLHEVQFKLSSTIIREYLLKKNQMKIEEFTQYRHFFENLMQNMGVKNQLVIGKWWSQIFNRYSEGWRYYHTNKHIYRMLVEWHSERYITKQQSLSPQSRNIAEIAILFHDIIYRPDSQSNQQESAKLSQLFLDDPQINIPNKQQFKKVTAELILQTKNHQPSTELSQIIYDLDMGILDDQNNYKEYAKNIKREYEPFYKESYAENRIKFLKKTLSQKLYYSFKPQHVQSNLQWEIFCLENHDL